MLFNLSTCNTMGPFIWKISFHLQFGPLFLFRSLICSIFLQSTIVDMKNESADAITRMGGLFPNLDLVDNCLPHANLSVVFDPFCFANF